jgi:hypothetical protein
MKEKPSDQSEIPELLERLIDLNEMVVMQDLALVTITSILRKGGTKEEAAQKLAELNESIGCEKEKLERSDNQPSENR